MDEGHLHHAHHASKGWKEELLGTAYINISEAFHGFQEGTIDATWGLAREEEVERHSNPILTPF